MKQWRWGGDACGDDDEQGDDDRIQHCGVVWVMGQLWLLSEYHHCWRLTVLAPPPEHLAMRSITTMKFFTFQFQLHDLSVPLSASIFLNLLLIHIFRDLSPYRPFQELNMKTKCLPMCTEQLSLLQKLEITSCLKSSKLGKSLVASSLTCLPSPCQ